MEQYKESISESEKFISSTKFEFQEAEQERIKHALTLMLEVHANQRPRPDGTLYIYHPLEVATRVLHSMTVKDADVVIAALLHDAVEDQAQLLASKEGPHDDSYSVQTQALKYIATQFGNRVRGIVASLSNPDFESILKNRGIKKNDPNYSTEFNLIYAHHVQEAIEDPDVAIIKYYDFSTNAFNLDKVIDEKRRARLTTKYYPVVSIFLDRIYDESKPLNIDQITRQTMIENLNNARIKMEAFAQATSQPARSILAGN